MENLVIITSIINTPNIELSYIKTRSVYDNSSRFKQTMITISRIKQYIPNSKILLVECSEFTKEQSLYFKNNCDYILNLYLDIKSKESIYSKSKALGEGTMTMEALKYIKINCIKFDNLFKISGRYYLNDIFNYDTFNNNKCIFKTINGNKNNINTTLYKLTFDELNCFYKFLCDNVWQMKKCIGYEVLISKYVNNFCKNVHFVDTIGIEGMVSVTGEYFKC